MLCFRFSLSLHSYSRHSNSEHAIDLAGHRLCCFTAPLLPIIGRTPRLLHSSQHLSLPLYCPPLPSLSQPCNRSASRSVVVVVAFPPFQSTSIFAASSLLIPTPSYSLLRSFHTLTAMAGLWRRYLHLLDAYPLPTKAVTSATLYAGGDGMAQYFDGTIARRGYNADRGVKAAIWGGVIFAPLAHVWYNRVLERFLPGTSNRAVLSKVALDQTAWGVAINSLYLTYVTLAINHGTLADAQQSITTKMWPLMKANWLLWPAVQLVNFRFVPAPLQVPFINIVILGWSVFLALLATEGGGEEDGKETGKVTDGGEGETALEVRKAERRSVEKSSTQLERVSK